METNKSTLARVASLDDGCEYSLAVIAKTDSESAYGVAANDARDGNVLCIKEIGSDKEFALSIVDILNKHRIPYVHFIDVINDLMNE
ncbi:MAG: hypothetical protein E7649_04660 [Ruminococcaceae bacterium]|nr:hypothetical protein [Oscillospiraceae bacterium]